MELGPNQKRWIEALRSGEYQQGHHALCDKDGKRCCLGIGCDVVGLKSTGVVVSMAAEFNGALKYGDEYRLAPIEVIDGLALRNQYGAIEGEHGITVNGFDKSELAYANDCGATFKQIADFCEKHPEAVFTEPK